MEDVLMEDVLMEDVLMEDALMEDVLMEDVLMEDVLMEDALAAGDERIQMYNSTLGYVIDSWCWRQDAKLARSCNKCISGDYNSGTHFASLPWARLRNLSSTIRLQARDPEGVGRNHCLCQTGRSCSIG
jgi:hypothetical protein